jgi:hypothetical protein
MLYNYDKKSLRFVRFKWLNWSLILLGVVSFFFLVINISAKIDQKITEDKIMVFLTERNHFTNEKFISKLKEMHFQFPHIIYGQALLETDHFRSRIFKENNNLFGMREATKRVNLCLGTENNYAYYNSWLDSVIDYGFYYSVYLSRLSNETEYLDFLGEFYAEDVNYVAKLKELIKTENLKSMFD